MTEARNNYNALNNLVQKYDKTRNVGTNEEWKALLANRRDAQEKYIALRGSSGFDDKLRAISASLADGQADFMTKTAQTGKSYTSAHGLSVNIGVGGRAGIPLLLLLMLPVAMNTDKPGKTAAEVL
jgi:hypothetical protein